uniref:Trichohyalin-like n=1 Tax=Sinocyclocheilus rhinocerous TaxID=307959 RepID=A0A673KLP6_9TELE
MAAWVEATTREMGQSLINPDKPSVSASALPGDTGKPAFGPKPHLMPKPFVLQRNATVRPIQAPKTNFSRELNRAASSEVLFDITKPGTGGSKPSESLKSDVKDVQPRSRAKSLGSPDQKILSQKVQGEAAKTEADVKMSSRCWPPRNRLSVELTSKFESPSQPEKEVKRDAETSKTEKDWPPHSPSESRSSKPLMEEGETGDEDVSGGSIKRRISLLFDRSTAAQHRDTFNKRDSPQAEMSVDIKQRIQNLSLDAPRTRLPSTGAPKSPPSEKTQSTSDEPPNERSSEKPATTEKVPGDKPASTTEIKNSAASVENVEEEEDDVAIPVGMSLDAEKKRREEEEKQRKDEQLEKERQQRERERLLEEEREAREIERQKEEEQERKQEEEKQRQMEERRKQEEERMRRIEEEIKEEERRRQAEKERERQIEEEKRRIQEDKERLREEERLEKLKKEKEMEERKRMEEERQKEEERLRQEQEKERLQKEKEMEEERRRIQEMERQREEERLRKERELERIRKEKEMEEEKQRIQEMERQKQEERLRQERELERIRKEKEMEEEKQRIQEMERQKEEERLRKEIQEMDRQKEEERLRQEQELERIRKEKEMKEEKQRIQEMERQKQAEERLRKEQELERIRKEEEEIEERKRMEEERQREEERLRQERERERLKKEKAMEEERQRIQELERQKEEDRLRQERENEMEMETCKAAERLREEVPTSYDLISFDAEGPAASQTLVSTVQAADVSPRLTEVIYDDFSVKPRRWGTGARRSSTPSPSREPPAAPDHSLHPEPKTSDPGSQEPCGDQVYAHDLTGFEPEASSPQNSTESRKQTYLFEESKPEDLLEPETQSDEGQLKDGEPEEDAVAEQDTENLIGETDEQNENRVGARINQVLQRLTQARRRNTSTDSDTADVPIQEEPEPLPVLETAAPLPDSRVFRSKVDLGKKRSIKRSRPSRSIRQRVTLPSLTEGTQPDWRFCDSTEAKDQWSNGADSESEEEPSQDVTSSPAPSQPKRVPVFPGMDPSALMAQLKRRSGVAETVNPTEAQTPPSVPTRSPRTPTRSLGPRVLPPVDAKDSGSGSSPSWLLELKSKKRMSQPESEA